MKINKPNKESQMALSDNHSKFILTYNSFI